MSIVEKPTSHSANHTFDNNGRIENGYYNGNCMESPSLPIPSIPSDLSFMSDGYRDDLESAPKCCGADDEYSTKSSKRRRKKNGSLKRAAKRIEDLDRSLSISLEELLQGVNATKSPLHPSNESLAFISPVVSPNATKKFSISPQLPQNDLLITEEDFDSLPISRNPIEVEPCDRPKRTSNSIIDGNDDATIIVKENDDVFRKREHGFSLPCFKSDSNNKQIIPGGDLNTKVPVTKNKDQFYSNAAKNKLHNNSCSPQVSDHKHVNNVAPPNTLNINLCAPDNTDSDLSPTSLEVGHILEHAYSENDLIDVEDDNETDYVSDFNHNDTLSSILGAKPKKHAAYSTPEYCKQLSSLSLEPIEDGLAIATQRDDEKLKLCRPRCAKEIQSDILVSGCVTFPGCYDLNRRPVLFVHCDVIDKSNGIGTIEIARLMLYFVSNSSYVTLLISQASEDTWEIVKKSVILFQENRPGVLSRIIVFTSHEDFSPSVHELKAECSTIHDKADLLDFLTFNNLPDYMGGNMLYNHAEWVKQRMDVESYVLLCERLQHSFANHSLAMTTASLPASLDDTTEALNKHRSTMTTLLDDERIRDLHNQGHRFLKFLQSEEKHENRSYAEQIQSSYEAVCSAIQRYVQSADERLLALEKHVLVKQFEESCDRIVTWAADRQDELQEKFGEVAESLNELRIQRQQFDCFYLEVVKQYAQCDCLLSEANQLSSSGFLGQVNSQAINAAEKISQVVQDMEMKKEEVETASQLFLFVDQAYSWALAGMKFVASLNMKDSMTTDELQELIQKYDEYMTSHPPIPEEEFARMQQIAAQFKNVKCQRQCEVAQQKCVEIGDLFMQRRKLIKKARDRQILELQKKEVEASPENNNQDDEIIETNNNDVTKITETNDTNSEKSIKPKTRAILRQSSDVSHRLVRPNGISNNSSLTNGTVQTMHGLIEAPLAPLVSKPRPKKMLRKSQSMSCHHGKPKIGAPMRGEEPNTQGRT